VSENLPRIEEVPDDDAQPLTGEPVGPAPMRLRAEPPRVTRLSGRFSPASVLSPASGSEVR
jgi:type IV secretion system protein VirB10